MSMRRLLVLAFLSSVMCESALEEELLIEPRLHMVDHSPPIANIHRGFHGPNGGGFEELDPNFDEAISFSVNTRGELGPTRAPLMCNCKVLTVVPEMDTAEGKMVDRTTQRRSFTAPELREHVPLVSKEYAKDHDEISFGVNMRGEEGPSFNPAWCTCKVLAAQVKEEEDEDEEEDKPPHSVGRGAAVPRSRGRPAVDGHRHPATPAVGEYIELAEGAESARVATPRRHRWATGVNVQQTVETPAAVITEFSYRGRHLNGPQLETTTQVLTEIDEGPDDSVAPSPAAAEPELEVAKQTNDTDTVQSAADTEAQTNSTAEIVVTSSAPQNTSEISIAVAPSPSPLPSPENVTTPALIPATPIDDDNDTNAVDALKHLAHSHPHASTLLAQAIQAAAAQQQENLRQLEEAIAKRDLAIKQLMEQNEKTETQLKYLVAMEQMRLMTASPSITPSSSPSSSPQPSPLPSPSPSSSPQLEWVAEQDERARHHQPRPNKKACYRQCRDTECAALFESSLRQYAACMDQCALKCYGS